MTENPAGNLMRSNDAEKNARDVRTSRPEIMDDLSETIAAAKDIPLEETLRPDGARAIRPRPNICRMKGTRSPSP
jgi:hypothetical protein